MKSKVVSCNCLFVCIINIIIIIIIIIIIRIIIICGLLAMYNLNFLLNMYIMTAVTYLVKMSGDKLLFAL